MIATVRDAETGQTEKIKCQYLVGCDGGISQVRTCLDIRYDGMARVAQLYMVHFRSDARDVLQPWGIAWHYQTSHATMIAQNDRDIWTLHTFLPPDLPLNEIDPSALCIASRDDRSHSRPSLEIPGTHTCSLPRATAVDGFSSPAIYRSSTTRGGSRRLRGGAKGIRTDGHRGRSEIRGSREDRPGNPAPRPASSSRFHLLCARLKLPSECRQARATPSRGGAIKVVSARFLKRSTE